MQHAFQIIVGTPKSSLPILATANDVREVVQLLKKKPEGITVVEASDATKRKLFDPRKIAAYELWGIISKSGDRIKLSRLGREFASRLDPESQLYRVLLDNTPPYRALLEWIHQQQLELVTHADIVGYWQEHFPEALQRGERTAEGHVLSFLQVCHAAEIGVATAGRKGQPSRLRVDHDELSAHLRSAARPARHLSEVEHPAGHQPARPRPASPQRLRVYISAPIGATVIGRIQDALQVADIVGEIVDRRADADELIPERTCQAMRRCEAGIIVVGPEDYETGAGGEATLKPSTLVEIGAAYVHYARRLVLLRDPRVRLPPNLEGFCYELDGEELTWEMGLQLVRAVKYFGSDLYKEAAPIGQPGA
jgi:hypothetical protein